MTYKEDIKMKKKNLLIKLAALTYSPHLNKFLKDAFTGQDTHLNKDASLEENRWVPKT